MPETICRQVETTLDGRMRKVALFGMVGGPFANPGSEVTSQAVKKLGGIGKKSKV